jgi:hypothetical protein
MLGVHLISTLVGLAVLLTSPLSLGWRGSIALILQLVAPLATVLARGLRTGRLRSGMVGIFLYWLYYWARLHALALVTLGQSERYRK